MRRKPTGYHVPVPTVGERCEAFIPAPLPPTGPRLQMDANMNKRLEQANIALGRLDGIRAVLPDSHLFLFTYLRKEAVLSSQIEGTQSSLSDLLLFESEKTPGVPLDDVREISNYVRAIQHGLDRIHDGFPVSGRLIREMHRLLLRSGRGESKNPGEFRRSQNWVGGTRPGNALFFPPPPENVMECMADLEKFLHDEHEKFPSLVKIGLAHAQFETIHPFLDGNGRIGRLLITFLLCTERLLQEPLLYLSLFFKQHRQQYYDLLQSTRTAGDWEAWLRFFLDGVRETANQAVKTAKRIMDLHEEDRGKIKQMRHKAGSALRVHHALSENPIGSISSLAQKTRLTYPTVKAALNTLMRMGIVRESGKRRRNRLFSYERYFDILTEGTEPL